MKSEGLVRAGAALLVMLLSTGCASTRAAQRVESHQRARSLLAQVESTPDLLDTFHTDPRVLDAIGIFLRAEDAENLSDADMNERVRHVFPNPPWDWVPAIEFRRVKSGLYFAALSQAFAGTPSSLYLFDGSRYVKVDSGGSGPVEVDDVYVNGNRLEIMYLPTRSSSAPRLTSALLEKHGGAWRVDHDTAYRRVTSLLARFSDSEVRDPTVHRDPRLLDAFGVFLENAGRLSDEQLWRHMSGLFPVEWHQAWPTFYIQRVGLALYLVGIESKSADRFNGSLYLFDGTSHVTLASDDTHWIMLEDIDIDGRRVEVTYVRAALLAPDQRESVVAEANGKIWRVTSRSATLTPAVGPP